MVYEGSNSPHPCQRLLLSDFLIPAILAGVKRYLIVVSICLSPMARDAEHLLTCLLANRIFGEISIYIFSFKKKNL